jgi:hypothetical protein
MLSDYNYAVSFFTFYRKAAIVARPGWLDGTVYNLTLELTLCPPRQSTPNYANQYDNNNQLDEKQQDYPNGSQPYIYTSPLILEDFVDHPYDKNIDKRIKQQYADLGKQEADKAHQGSLPNDKGVNSEVFRKVVLSKYQFGGKAQPYNGQNPEVLEV